MNRVSIIAVGTEITSGEILNRNSQWLSSQLESLGFDVVLHLTVGDERKLMRDAFDIAFHRSDVLVITGGLGPTSDDFTRDVVADYVGQSLKFREDVFASLRKLYETRGLPLREAHKQQCYFPEQAELLENPVGTALGFLVEREKKKIFVLPGPPREVEGVFERAMRPALEKLHPVKRVQLQKWKILAVPESEVAERVEPVVQKYKLQVGYRASAPYVIVKVWMPIENEKTNKKIQDEINGALEGWTVLPGDQDLAEDLIKELQKYSEVRIVDEATGGKLAARFEPFIKNVKDLHLEWTSRNFHVAENLRSMNTHLTIRLENEGYRVAADVAGQVFSEKLMLPYKLDPLTERGRIQMCEQAIWHWLKDLRHSTVPL